MPDAPPDSGARIVPKHRLLIAPEQRTGERVQFSPEQARHLVRVLRLGPGARLAVFDGTPSGGHMVELTHASATRAEGRVVQAARPADEPRTRLVVHPALVQRDKLEQVLQKLVEVGASAVRPVLAQRSVVRRLPEEDRLVRWRSIMRAAAEQCGRGRVPDLLPPARFEAALRAAADEGPVLLAYEVTAHSQPLSRVLGRLRQDRPGSVSLFVGPEGGYADAEVALATAAGATLVSLGPRTLRAETASPIFTAMVLFGLGELE